MSSNPLIEINNIINGGIMSPIPRGGISHNIVPMGVNKIGIKSVRTKEVNANLLIIFFLNKSLI